jgi:hypothetical protein
MKRKIIVLAIFYTLLSLAEIGFASGAVCSIAFLPNCTLGQGPNKDDKDNGYDGFKMLRTGFKGAAKANMDGNPELRTFVSDLSELDSLECQKVNNGTKAPSKSLLRKEILSTPYKAKGVHYIVYSNFKNGNYKLTLINLDNDETIVVSTNETFGIAADNLSTELKSCENGQLIAKSNPNFNKINSQNKPDPNDNLEQNNAEKSSATDNSGIIETARNRFLEDCKKIKNDSRFQDCILNVNTKLENFIKSLETNSTKNTLNVKDKNIPARDGGL